MVPEEVEVGSSSRSGGSMGEEGARKGDDPMGEEEEEEEEDVIVGDEGGSMADLKGKEADGFWWNAGDSEGRPKESEEEFSE